MAAKEMVEPVYIELTQPHFDARFGKMPAGRIVPVQPEQALRWKTAGIAKDSTERAYNRAKEDRTQTGDKRVAALQAMNDEDSALWDVHYRDAVLADPEKLKIAMDRGLVPTNLNALQDDDGLALGPDATYEEIMDARDNIQHPDAGIDAHTSASTSGNRSHYSEPVPDKQQRVIETVSTATPARRVGRVSRNQVANAAEEPQNPRVTQQTTGDTLGNVTKD